MERSTVAEGSDGTTNDLVGLALSLAGQASITAPLAISCNEVIQGFPFKLQGVANPDRQVGAPPIRDRSFNPSSHLWTTGVATLLPRTETIEGVSFDRDVKGSRRETDDGIEIW